MASQDMYSIVRDKTFVDQSDVQRYSQMINSYLSAMKQNADDIDQIRFGELASQSRVSEALAPSVAKIQDSIGTLGITIDDSITASLIDLIQALERLLATKDKSQKLAILKNIDRSASDLSIKLGGGAESDDEDYEESDSVLSSGPEGRSEQEKADFIALVKKYQLSDNKLKTVVDILGNSQLNLSYDEMERIFNYVSQTKSEDESYADNGVRKLSKPGKSSLQSKLRTIGSSAKKAIESVSQNLSSESFIDQMSEAVEQLSESLLSRDVESLGKSNKNQESSSTSSDVGSPPPNGVYGMVKNQDEYAVNNEVVGPTNGSSSPEIGLDVYKEYEKEQNDDVESISDSSPRVEKGAIYTNLGTIENLTKAYKKEYLAQAGKKIGLDVDMRTNVATIRKKMIEATQYDNDKLEIVKQYLKDKPKIRGYKGGALAPYASREAFDYQIVPQEKHGRQKELEIHDGMLGKIRTEKDQFRRLPATSGIRSPTGRAGAENVITPVPSEPNFGPANRGGRGGRGAKLSVGEVVRLVNQQTGAQPVVRGQGIGSCCHQIKGGKLGNLDFDMNKMKRLHLLAKRNGKKVMEGKIPYDLWHLLNRSYSDKVDYSPSSLERFRKILEVAEVPITKGYSKKLKLIRGNNGYTKMYGAPHQLFERLQLIMGSLESGNRSNELINEASEILDQLKKHKLISGKEMAQLLKKIV